MALAGRAADEEIYGAGFGLCQPFLRRESRGDLSVESLENIAATLLEFALEIGIVDRPGSVMNLDGKHDLGTTSDRSKRPNCAERHPAAPGEQVDDPRLRPAVFDRGPLATAQVGPIPLGVHLQRSRHQNFPRGCGQDADVDRTPSYK